MGRRWNEKRKRWKISTLLFLQRLRNSIKVLRSNGLTSETISKKYPTEILQTNMDIKSGLDAAGVRTTQAMHFPEELVVSILIRLPVKSLVRFRCVCKTWCSLISDSDFIHSHLHHNQVAENYSVLIRQYTSNYEHDYYSLHSDNEQFNQIQTLHFHFPVDYFAFVGSANGLICLWDKNKIRNYHIIILWNLALNKFFNLPVLRLSQSIEGFVISSSCFGFGYDLSSRDFKVVMFITYKNRSEIHPMSPDQISTSVFSLARKSWKTLDHSDPMVLYSEPCNVGGFLYHLVSVPGLDEHKIVSFDLRDKVFSDIACPLDADSGRLLLSGLTQFRDSLAQFNHWGCDSGNRYNIWVMGDDGVAKSWMKIFSVIYLAGSVPTHYMPGFSGFSKKGLLVVIGERGFFAFSDLEDARVVYYVPPDTQIHEMEKYFTRWHVDSYQESLVLLEDGDNLFS